MLSRKGSALRMTDPLPNLDRIEQSIADARAEASMRVLAAP